MAPEEHKYTLERSRSAVGRRRPHLTNTGLVVARLTAAVTRTGVD